ncbi:MAG: Nif3-like dinuclear metal center hexameric protein [Thomasclavelia ramosa]
MDAYITGDSKHRHAKYALDHDIVLIDVPHHLEVIMEKRLASLLSNLGITVKERIVRIIIHIIKKYFDACHKVECK